MRQLLRHTPAVIRVSRPLKSMAPGKPKAANSDRVLGKQRLQVEFSRYNQNAAGQWRTKVKRGVATLTATPPSSTRRQKRVPDHAKIHRQQTGRHANRDWRLWPQCERRQLQKVSSKKPKFGSDCRGTRRSSRLNVLKFTTQDAHGGGATTAL